MPTEETDPTMLHPGLSGVRKAGRADAAAVSAALAAAFHADPLWQWMIPDDAQRGVATGRFFDLVVDVLAPHDDAWTTEGEVAGAALWVPYGRKAMSKERGAAFTAEIAEIAGPYAERMTTVAALLDEHHPREPHEYLWFLGVVPAAQGRGIGGALLAPVLARADAAGHPCYLESSSPRNRTLYERNGFVARPALSPPGGPPISPMWRAARGAPAR